MDYILSITWWIIIIICGLYDGFNVGLYCMYKLIYCGLHGGLYCPLNCGLYDTFNVGLLL